MRSFLGNALGSLFYLIHIHLIVPIHLIDLVDNEPAGVNSLKGQFKYLFCPQKDWGHHKYNNFKHNKEN
jgi:hypothetical protein